MPDLRDDPTPREHTWQEATDNIRSGNIALKNNTRFAVSNYKYLSDKWVSIPPIRLLWLANCYGWQLLLQTKSATNL